GSFSQTKIHSRLVLSAMCESDGGSSVAVMILPSAALTVWQWTQPWRASRLRPKFSCGVPGNAPRWHCPQEDSMYFAGRIGCSHAKELLCASATVVAAPWPRWHIVHPN